MRPKTELERLIEGHNAQVLVRSPFFGSLLMSLRIREDHGEETGAVDGQNLFVNPDWLATLTAEQVRGFLAHEAWHCAAGHHTRRGERDPEDWNIACDIPTNAAVESAGFVLPPGAIVDPGLADKSPEEIYDLRRRQRQQGGGQGAADQAQDCDRSDDEITSKADKSAPNGDKDGQNTDQNPRSDDIGARNRDSGGCGAVRDAKPLDGNGGVPSPADLRQQQAEWQTRMAQAAQTARAMGQMPAALEALIEEAMNPPADPWAVLRDFMSRTVNPSHYAWNPPARRHLWQDLVLPSMVREGLGTVVLGVDTSGSVTEELFSVFVGHMNLIFDEYTPQRLLVVYCDSRVHHTDELEPGDAPEFRRHGIGGTSFAPVFDWVEENDVKPDCLVYLTDLEGHEPDQEPDYPVLWAAVPPYNDRRRRHWGEVVELPA